jgi:hypothetical protein
MKKTKEIWQAPEKRQYLIFEYYGERGEKSVTGIRRVLLGNLKKKCQCEVRLKTEKIKKTRTKMQT